MDCLREEISRCKCRSELIDIDNCDEHFTELTVDCRGTTISSTHHQTTASTHTHTHTHTHCAAECCCSRLLTGQWPIHIDKALLLTKHGGGGDGDDDDYDYY